MRKPDFTAREREMIERFKADLPKILAGQDPFVPSVDAFIGQPFPDKIECSVDGCTDAACLKGMCQPHYNKQWRREDLAKQAREMASVRIEPK